jgi:L-ribulose-5-phosphate 4-epimerase
VSFVARTDDAQREQYVRGVKTEVAIARTRAEVASLSAELVHGGFAGWGGGDVSSRVAGADLFVIKPPAGEHDDLAPENAIVCDHDGAALAGTPGSERLPASDVAVHARIYRDLADVRGVVRSQSPHTLAHAATGDGIPCLVVAMAERFGGGIPVVTPSLDDADAVAAAVAEALGAGSAPAVLVKGDGAYVTGASAREAVESARLVEQMARVAVLAPAAGAARRDATLSVSTVELLHGAFRDRITQSTADRR